MIQPVLPPAVVFGDGPPVVLLHAFPLDGRMWIEHAESLSAHNQILVPDLRGFGSAYEQLAGLDEIPIDLLADDIARLLDERAIEKAVVGGISRGGYVALAFARRHAHRLCGLMLFDTRASAADERETHTYTELPKRLAIEGSGAAVEAMKTRFFGPSTLANNHALINKVNAFILDQHPDAIAAAARGMIRRQDAFDLLPHIHVPTLALAGEDDAAFTATQTIAENIPGAKFVAVPNAGHLSTLEQPEFVVEVMRSFLAGLVDEVADSLADNNLR